MTQQLPPFTMHRSKNNVWKLELVTCKRDLYRAVLVSGLASANRGNPFWTRSDAMSSFSLFHKNARKQS